MHISAPISPAELAARRAIAESSQRNVDVIFNGARLVLNYDRRKEYRAAAVADLRTAASSGLEAGAEAARERILDPRRAVVALLREMLPGATEIEEAIEDLIPDIAAELASAAPYLGPCISVARGATNLAAAGRHTFQRVKVQQHSQVITPGAPLLAVKNMQKVLERQIGREVSTGSRHIATGATNITLTALSMGADWASPTIGAANALFSFAQNVYFHILDMREMKQANQAMQQPHVTLAVFDTSPIVGCFHVGMVPTSDLLAGIAYQIGATPDWMTQTEKIVKQHIHPLQSRATVLIQQSRFYLDTPMEHANLSFRAQNKASLRAIDGSGPKAKYNLVMNKKYNFGRHVSEAKYTVRGAITKRVAGGLERAGFRRLGAQLRNR